VLALGGAALAAGAVRSPDGKVAVTFHLGPGGAPGYRVDYNGKPVVLESRLGFEPDFTAGFEILKTSSRQHKSQWTNPFGERRNVPDHYRELVVHLKHASGRLLRISLRAYNEGAAFRYSFPTQPKFKEFSFAAEKSEFRFPEDTWGYEEHGAEGEYKRSKIPDIAPKCERPLTLEYASGLFASVTEAAADRYPRTLLSGVPSTPGALFTDLGGPVNVNPPFVSPWRLIVVGEKPGDLLERNYLVLNLNDPVALKDTSWIKPGKAMRDVALSTINGKAVVDFAARHNLQYVGFDWGWYGTENPDAGDATRVSIDRRRTANTPDHPGLDLHEVIRYGKEKGVGVVLYVDRRQAKRQRDVIFPLYAEWGVKGVKLGFVDVGPQEETAWVQETIRKAAEHRLVLDIHDQFRPTGYARTYPNLLTMEGIRGNEQMPTPEHNATLPFTRYIAGMGDYTVCYFTPRKKTTFAHQLAMAVVSFSPMQWVFWYDRPSDYQGEPEIEFFERVPTVWDDTKVIHGRIGEYATIARQRGDDWFVGTINNKEPRQLQLPLSFLKKGVEYTARIYSDNDAVPTRTKVAIETRQVNSRTTLEVSLRAAGGQAVWMTPARNVTRARGR
jgi:alpha-glucosidase